jgi:hypothetical protein
MKKFLEKIGGPKKDGAPALLGKTVQVGLSQVRVEALLGEGEFVCDARATHHRTIPVPRL